MFLVVPRHHLYHSAALVSFLSCVLVLVSDTTLTRFSRSAVLGLSVRTWSPCMKYCCLQVSWREPLGPVLAVKTSNQTSNQSPDISQWQGPRSHPLSGWCSYHAHSPEASSSTLESTQDMYVHSYTSRDGLNATFQVKHFLCPTWAFGKNHSSVWKERRRALKVPCTDQSNSKLLSQCIWYSRAVHFMHTVKKPWWCVFVFIISLCMHGFSGK